MPYFFTQAFPDENFKELIKQAGELDYPSISYGCLTGNVDIPGRKPAVFLHYPEKWVARYFDKKYGQLDPVLQKPFQQSRPFVWRQLTGLSKQQQHFMQDAADYGLADGFSVPAYGPGGSVFVICFARDRAVDEADCPALVTLAGAFHASVLPFLNVDKNLRNITLGRKEKEVLALLVLAPGLKQDEIAERLDININTVGKRIKKLHSMFETSTLPALVYAAIQHGALS